MTPAVPQPSIRRMGQPNTETEAGPIRQLFGDAVKALTQPAPKPAAPKKHKQTGDDDKGRGGLRLLSRYTVLKRAAVTSRIARVSLKQGKPITATSCTLPPPDRLTALAADMADTLDWMNAFEPPDAFTGDIDADYGAAQSWNFPQP